VLCLYEDEVVLLQDRLLQGGLAKGLPGITYELADLQVGGGGQGWVFWNDPHQAISGGSSGGSGQQGGWYMLAILLPSQHDSCNTSTC
jgi:hypothetical protein